MGSTNVTGMVKALEKSSKEIEFGAIKLVSHLCPRVHYPTKIKFQYVDKIKSIDEWNRKIIYELHNYVDTDFAMLIHADGYVINPQAWKDEFLDYDYIGAPWPLPQDDYSYRTGRQELIRVGNSVSLRSKQILRLPFQLNLPWKPYYGNTNEDGFLCVHNKYILEEQGIKFAPLEVAKYFSKEHEIEENKGLTTFAFHSL